MTKPLLNKGPHIMGIVNVTPDSFSDGGRFIETQKAVDHALQLIADGADIIDIGGESTRPGAETVSVQQEMDRVIPVIEKLKNCGKLISVDTRNAATMKAALSAGAGMINDVSALRHDSESVTVVAAANVPVCLMHMLGSPQTMQNKPIYTNVVQEIFEFMHQRISVCETAGIEKTRIIADPGIGFGKELIHNLDILRSVSKFKDLGVPILIGASRKSFISKIDPNAGMDQRLGGSLATALWCLQQGVTLFRVHDVAQTKQAFEVYQAIRDRA